MTRLQAFLIFIALWAGIFLPGLGSTELKGEEGRRILPAITMLETGNWVVPYVGGLPYVRKPPLVNWLIAASFHVTGQRDEWSARLPTVLALLALGTLMIAVAHERWMSPSTALVAAILALTKACVLDKGRLAEIEGLYLSLAGMGIVLWLACWARGDASPWWQWCGPALFLGLAMLAKGPTHLLFFYAIVFAVIWKARAWREFAHPAPYVGLLVILGIFALWAWPYFHEVPADQTLKTWQGQSAGRLTGRFDWGNYLSTIPRALKDLLPWVLFTPLLWRADLAALGERRYALFTGTRLAVVATFFGLLLLPGMLPRYTMPLLAPFGCLLALVLADEALPPPSFALRQWWRANALLAGVIIVAAIAAPIAVAVGLKRSILFIPASDASAVPALLLGAILASAGALMIGLVALFRRRKLARPSLIACTSAALVAAGLLLWAGAGIPFTTAHDRVRPLAQKIDDEIPPAKTIYLLDPEYLPAIFYLKHQYQYVFDVRNLDHDAEWLLVREETYRKADKEWYGYRPVKRFPEPKGVSLVLLNRPH